MEKINWENFAFYLLVILLHFANETSGLHDVTVTIPKVVASGGVATLGCRWVLDVGETLYSVKWYRSRQEFYRYLPKELPHTRVFTHEGIIVDLNRSSQHQVVLRDLTRNLTGRYQCEVSADAPSFHTELATSYMHIVDLPQSGPVIAVEKTLYSAEDTLRANCSSPPADPPAEITWMVNGKLANGMLLHQDLNDITFNVEAFPLTSRTTVSTPLNATVFENRSNENLSTNFIQSTTKSPVTISPKWKRRKSTSALEIVIRPEFFVGSKIKLTCVASVHTIYSSKSEIEIDEEKPQIAPVLGTRDIGDGASNAIESIRPAELTIFFITALKMVQLLLR